MIRLPTRCVKYGVGKEIGGAVYLHRRYIDALPKLVGVCLKNLKVEPEFTVVKYSEKSEMVSFIETSEFDEADEPEVGDVLTVKLDGRTSRRARLADPYIYHHKWLFVTDDYSGFNVEASKERSRLWLGLDGVDKKRIGRKSYWVNNVLPRIQDLSQSGWLGSREMAKKLNVSDCELAHLRQAGKLEFRKRGNAFLYRYDVDATEVK